MTGSLGGKLSGPGFRGFDFQVVRGKPREHVPSFCKASLLGSVDSSMREGVVPLSNFSLVSKWVILYSQNLIALRVHFRDVHAYPLHGMTIKVVAWLHVAHHIGKTAMTSKVHLLRWHVDPHVGGEDGCQSRKGTSLGKCLGVDLNPDFLTNMNCKNLKQCC